MAKEKLKDIILDDIRMQILSGKYKTGERLPTERALAEKYGTSRIPVREALAELSENGVVKTFRGAGTVVIASGKSLDAANGVFEEEASPILLEALSLRKLLESEAARQAAIARTYQDLREIQAAIFENMNEMRKLKIKEKNAAVETDVKFHKAIAKASHVPLFLQCLDAMPVIIATHQYISLKNTYPKDEVITYHTKVYESILDGDAEKAYSAMFAHISRVEELITKKNAARGSENALEGEE